VEVPSFSTPIKIFPYGRTSPLRESVKKPRRTPVFWALILIEAIKIKVIKR
jgi:hypothetical protein